MDYYALIKDGIVESIIVGNILMDGYECVPVDEKFPVTAGDVYMNGCFYRSVDAIFENAKRTVQYIEQLENDAADIALKYVNLTIENAMLELMLGIGGEGDG